MIQKARRLLFLSVMPATRGKIEKGKCQGLMTFTDEDGMIYVTSRVSNISHNPDKQILLPPSHPLTKLILRHLHEISHRSVAHVVARSRLWYWIPQCSKIVKSIQNKCTKCKLLNVKAMEQMMSPVPDIRSKPTPTWHYSMIDLAGPVNVKGFVNQRKVRKTWIVILPV